MFVRCASYYNLFMDLSGVYPPIPTPFVSDGETVDVKGLSGNVRRWMASGLRGLVVLGSNGEAPLLDEHESDTAIETVRASVPRERLVIAGTGRESTKATTDASRRAAALGADVVLVRTPSYFRPQMTDDAFLAHYTAVAEGSPIPVLLYNHTALTGVTLPIKVVARLAEHPNIVGMKESGGDIGFVSSLVDETPDDFSVLVGSAPTFYVSLLSGAVGGIMALAAVAPGECVELYHLVQSRRYGDARQLQKRLTPLARLVTRAYGVAGLKVALDLLGYVGGPPRPPLRPGGREAAAELGGALAELGMLPTGGMLVANVAAEPLRVGKTERKRC